MSNIDNNQQVLQLQLTLEELNLILKALGSQPFNQVYEIIGKIHDQANQQLKNKNDK
jgi:hypothetical protein